MKNKEKIPIKKESAIDEVQKYIDEHIKKHEGEITQSQLIGIERDKILPEVEKLFLDFISGGDFIAIAPRVLALKEKIEKIKDEKTRGFNLRFLGSFDHKINPDITITRENNEQGNG